MWQQQTRLGVWHHICVVARRAGAAVASLAVPNPSVAACAGAHSAGPAVLHDDALLLAGRQRVGAGDGQLGVPQHRPNSGIASIDQCDRAFALPTWQESALWLSDQPRLQQQAQRGRTSRQGCPRF